MTICGRTADIVSETAGVLRAEGHTVNDVVLACVAGAARSYLEAREQGVDDLDFRALVPVSTRTPEQRGKLDEIDAAFQQSFAALSAEEQQQLSQWCAQFEPVWRGEAKWPDFIAGFQLTKKVDRTALARGIDAVCQST